MGAMLMCQTYRGAFHKDATGVEALIQGEDGIVRQGVVIGQPCMKNTRWMGGILSLTTFGVESWRSW